MFCNYCGVANPDDSSFCGACGKRIGNAAVPSAPTSAEAAPPPELATARPSVQAPSATPAPPGLSLPRSAPWWIALAAVGLAAIFFARGRGADASAPVQDPPAASSPASEQAPDATPPVSLAPPSPVAVPVPAAPPNPLVGRWKTSLLIGDGYLTFTSDGRIHIEHVFTDEWDVYVYSDGDLAIQNQGFFDHDITHWQVQVSGDTLTVIEPEGASHIYTRVADTADAAPIGSSPTGELVAQVLKNLASSAPAQEPSAPAGEGRLEDFSAVVQEAVTGSGAPRVNIEPEPQSFWLEVCAPPSVVAKSSWAQRDSAGSQAVRDALSRFLATHRFRDVSADEASSGSVQRIVRVSESALDQFEVAEVSDEASECSGDSETSFRVDLAQAPPAPSTSDGGFGDAIGDGGFIKPLPNP